MKAIIRTNDRNLFNSLVHFLKLLHITVETVEEKNATTFKKQKEKFDKAEKFWRSLKVDMKGFKFNREDAYER